MHTHSHWISHELTPGMEDNHHDQKKSAATIIQVSEDFLNRFQSEETKRTYVSVLRAFLQTRRLHTLTLHQFMQRSNSQIGSDIQAFLNDAKRYDEKIHRIINPRTVNKKRAVLSSFFRYLRKQHHYAHDPLESIPVLRYTKLSSTQSLNESEVRLLLRAMKKKVKAASKTTNLSQPVVTDNPMIPNKKTNSSKRTITTLIPLRNYLIVLLLYRLALRRSELVNISWNDIDLDQGIVSIIQKGGTLKRLPLPLDVMRVVRHYQTELMSAFQAHSLKQEEQSLKTEELKTRGWSNTSCSIPSHLFVCLDNRRLSRYCSIESMQPLSLTSIYEVIKKEAKAIFPEKNITPHSLRKTFIEIALTKNIGVTALMNATGHESVQMIRYYDTRDKIKQNAILLL